MPYGNYLHTVVLTYLLFNVIMFFFNQIQTKASVEKITATLQRNPSRYVRQFKNSIPQGIDKWTKGMDFEMTFYSLTEVN